MNVNNYKKVDKVRGGGADKGVVLYMAQISEGGEDSKGMSYFFKMWDLNVTRNALICMLRLLPQFNDTNGSMDLEQK